MGLDVFMSCEIHKPSPHMNIFTPFVLSNVDPRSILLIHHSSPVSLPQSTKKAKRETVNEANKEDEIVQEPKSNRSSLQPSRGKLWDHPEEELPILTTPLEVDSETPVADALIKRLQDEEGMLEIICTLKMHAFNENDVFCLLFRSV